MQKLCFVSNWSRIFSKEIRDKCKVTGCQLQLRHFLKQIDNFKWLILSFLTATERSLLSIKQVSHRTSLSDFSSRQVRRSDSCKEPHQKLINLINFSCNSLLRMSRALGWTLSQNGTCGRSFQKKCRINVPSSSHLTGKLSRRTLKSLTAL